MAVTDFFIGAFDFIDFPRPDVRKIQTEIESRSGVDGHSLWLTGTRGTVRGYPVVRDALSIVDGNLIWNNWQAIIGTPQNVTWAGILLPRKFDVVDIQPGEGGAVQAITAGVGGRLGGSSAVVNGIFFMVETGIART